MTGDIPLVISDTPFLIGDIPLIIGDTLEGLALFLENRSVQKDSDPSKFHSDSFYYHAVEFIAIQTSSPASI